MKTQWSMISGVVFEPNGGVGKIGNCFLSVIACSDVGEVEVDKNE